MNVNPVYINTTIYQINLNEYGIVVFYKGREAFIGLESTYGEIKTYVLSIQTSLKQSNNTFDLFYHNKTKQYIFDNLSGIKVRLNRSNLSFNEFIEHLKDFTMDEKEELLLLWM